ncbi:MAG: DUF308 domain-containing protein [Ignavibacteriae bacterium]|jgi:uncharacterized membrane protein HdeD (DUF308 family)|nr:DUF308 domain-containing protein [Ignavibacteriota bacterium]
MKIKILGVFTIFLGVFSMIVPSFTGFSILLAIGIIVLAGGIARLFWAFQADSFAKGVLRFVLGGLTLLFGIYLIANPIFASGVLTIIMAIYFLADGISELATGIQHRKDGGGWWIFGGVVSILLAFMIWAEFPLSGAWAIGILIGVKLLFAGMVMLMAGKLVTDTK